MDMILSCVLNASGLSRAAQEFYRLFGHKGIRVIPNFIQSTNLTFVDEDLGKSMADASFRPIHPGPIQMLVGIPGSAKEISGRKAFVGSIVVEGNILSKRQRMGVGPMDCVMVPSTFCRTTFLKSGYPRRKTFLVPYPMDSSRWNTSVVPSTKGDGRFRFLFMNTWYERKGWDVLLKAWWDEFSSSDPVELVVKTYRDSNRPKTAEEIIAVAASRMGVKRSKKAPITIIDDQMHDEDLPGFMKSFDALVSPHRSEGFGMNPWYAMALGVPVICTDYGGVTDFAKDDTAWMIPSMGFSTPSVEEARTFSDFEGIEWAEPDGIALRRIMREVSVDVAARKQRASNGASIVASQYSWDSVFGSFGDALRISVPNVWDSLLKEIEFARIVRQNAPKIGSLRRPIRLVEI
jgi:glycosyltransferase involved in cell wall biosynthesis